MFKRIGLFAALMVFAIPVMAQKQAEINLVGDNQQITFFNGATTVQFSNDFVGALNSLNIGVGRITPGPIIRRSASFPITSGSLDLSTLRGEILHSGGLKLFRGQTSIKLESFIIDTTGDGIVLTGMVSANGTIVGRVPLFDLTLPSSDDLYAGVNIVTLNGVSVTLRPEAAGALNAVFETTAFEAGFLIGTAGVRGLAFAS
jgi:hypothetical protein